MANVLRLPKKAKEKKEVFEAYTQESDKKAIPIVQEVMKRLEKKQQKKEAIDLELLGKARQGKILHYNQLLANLLVKRLSLIDWPTGWGYQVFHNKIGVILEMTSPKNRIFRAAFKPTGEREYDLNAVETYALRAENTIDRITGADKNTKVPTGGILKNYGHTT